MSPANFFHFEFEIDLRQDKCGLFSREFVAVGLIDKLFDDMLVAVELILNILVFLEDLSIPLELELLQFFSFQLLGVVLSSRYAGLYDMLYLLVLIGQALVLFSLEVYSLLEVFEFLEQEALPFLGVS